MPGRGFNFAELAEKYSDDEISGKVGGMMTGV